MLLIGSDIERSLSVKVRDGEVVHCGRRNLVEEVTHRFQLCEEPGGKFAPVAKYTWQIRSLGTGGGKLKLLNR